MTEAPSSIRRKVLIVDDESAIRRFLRASLPDDEYAVIEAEFGREAIRLAATHNPDLILLDLGLLDIDGLEVVRTIREWTRTPIIVLSAREHESDKVTALDLGADDYLTKPFSVPELLARIRVALRHKDEQSTTGTEAHFVAGRLKVDFSSREVFLDGETVHLTPLEYKLLVALVRNAGKVLTHRALLVAVWGEAYVKETHYLRIYMKQLRHKIERDPAQPEYLTTETGVGYRFKLPA